MKTYLVDVEKSDECREWKETLTMRGFNEYDIFDQLSVKYIDSVSIKELVDKTSR